MRGEVFTLCTVDKIVDDDDAQMYHMEYFNRLILLMHELNLKVYAHVILLCNLYPSTGLCNIMPHCLSRINQTVVECEILGGKHSRNMSCIPCILLLQNYVSTSDVPCFLYG